MENRFEVVKKEDIAVDRWTTMSVLVLRDKQTGVMYIAAGTGKAGGLTPLLDKDGNPMTTFKVSV